MGQHGRIPAQRLEVFAFWQTIHPGTQAFIADELHHTNALVNRRVLGSGAIQFVVERQHGVLALCYGPDMELLFVVYNVSLLLSRGSRSGILAVALLLWSGGSSP